MIDATALLGAFSGLLTGFYQGFSSIARIALAAAVYAAAWILPRAARYLCELIDSYIHHRNRR